STAGAASSATANRSSIETASAFVIAYSVLTDGWLFAVSIWEIMLAETPTSRARPRRLIPRLSRSSRIRGPSHGTSDAAIPTSFVRRQVFAVTLHATDAVSGEDGADLVGVCDERIARERDGGESSFSGGGVPSTARVADDDRNVAEIGGVPDRRIDAHLERYPGDE